MQQAIEKAKALVQAMGYIQSFRDRIVVVKLGGSVLEDIELQKKMITDVVFMATVGMHPVIVHGGGKAITRAMEESGLEPTWVHGRRYTDQRTLTIAEHTLVRNVNEPICRTIEEAGIKAMPLHSLSSCVLTASPLRLENVQGRKIDLGLVGTCTAVNAELLTTLTNAHIIPVISPVALDKNGGKLNVNADNVAAMVAGSIKAEKLVSVSDTHGIMKNIADPDSRISTATKKQIKQMIDDGTISSGMRPKVESCINAIEAGVKKAHIIDGRIPHSLLLEIYTEQGIGTQILLD